MLELLAKYARDQSLEAEPGFKPKQVRWLVVCNDEGELLGVVELGDTGAKRNPGLTFPKCPEIDANVMQSGGKSHFLVETAEVVALLDKEGDGTEKTTKHEYFVGLVKQASTAMPELTAVAKLLADGKALASVRAHLHRQSARPTDKLTFKVGDSIAVESDVWHDWWRGFRRGLFSARLTKKPKEGQGESARLMRCFTSGDLVEPLATHPKVKGLTDVGGQAMGGVLIGFDKDSFCSYGLSQSANAATSEEGANAYRAALDDLLQNHSQRLAGAKVAHWFNKTVPPEDDPLSWLEAGADEQERNAQQRARELLEGIRTGKRIDLLDNCFYALTLSGSGGRVMVRDWMEGQFEELAGNISRWFDDLSVVTRDGQGLIPSPKFLAVLGSTVRELADLPPPFAARMWRVAVQDEPIPHYALAQALARARTSVIRDEPPNHARMGLMKAYHVRKHRMKGETEMSQDLKPYLNEEHPLAAYQCGRLMAMLADLQRAALGDVGAGVVQRYYAAASATPSLVLGRLTRTSQFHLNKLEPGLAYWFETVIARIWGRIEDTLPRTLTLEEQSLFALGYYQQMAHIRAGGNKAN